jgi:DNA-binding MarR family transcriptional regulator
MQMTEISTGHQEDIMLEATLGWLFQDVHAQMTRSFDKRTKKVGLTRSQWRVLSPLMKKQGVTQTTLAEIVEIEKAPLGRTLDKLEETGWIRREDDPNDRRARRVFLTSKIDPHVEAVTDTVRATFGDALHGLKAEEIADLMRYLMTIKSNLQAAEAKA